jgi:hypothetical protein
MVTQQHPNTHSVDEDEQRTMLPATAVSRD